MFQNDHSGCDMKETLSVGVAWGPGTCEEAMSTVQVTGDLN